MAREYGGFVSLSALLALLYARLPGPKTSNRDIDPRKRFWCEQEVDGVLVKTNAADLSWLSTAVNGIVMRKVQPGTDNQWYLVENAEPVGSNVTVSLNSPSEFQLQVDNENMKQLLLNAAGYYSIITVRISGERAEANPEKLGETFVKGRGNGIWEIQDRR